MTTLAELTRRAHERYASAPALYDGARWRSFAELGAAARRVAHRLAAAGVRPGDRIVLALDNRPEVLVVEHALYATGLVRVALSSRLHGREIAAIAADCGAAVVLCEDTAAPALRAAPGSTAPTGGADTDHGVAGRDGGGPGARTAARPAPGAPGRPWVVTVGDGLAELVAPGVPDAYPDWRMPGQDELAALMYTSGSTGEPKGAMVTQRGWVAMVRAFWAALPPLGPGDVVVHAAPMSHFGGSAGSAVTLRGGTAAPVRRFEPATVLDTVAERRATVLPSVPTMLKALTEAAAGRTDLSSLRAIPYGGSAISAPAAARAHAVFGEVLYQCYGLSEALAPVTVLDARDHAAGGPRLASAGRPTPEVEVRIAADTGEVLLRGDCVLPGYWNRPPVTEDGWFRTGDVGRFDDEGYLHLVDRLRDVIVSGGFTVYPSEVERAVADLPDVRDVVVYGMPHERWGEAVAAVVVPRPGATLTAEDVVAACRERLASYKKPLHVEFTDSLPTASTGKVARRELRAAAWARHARRVGE